MGKIKRLAGETVLYGLGSILPRFLNFLLGPFTHGCISTRRIRNNHQVVCLRSRDQHHLHVRYGDRILPVCVKTWSRRKKNF